VHQNQLGTIWELYHKRLEWLLMRGEVASKRHLQRLEAQHKRQQVALEL